MSPRHKRERKLKRLPLKRLSPEELRAWRLKHGLTQQELGWLLGLSRSAISGWEQGARKIPPYLSLLLEVLEKHLKEERGAVLLKKVQFYKHYLILAEDLYRESEPQKITPNISDLRRRKLYGAIIFLAFALESFINEVGIEFFPNEFDAIEKLSTPDKWYLIPRLKSIELFEKGKEPYQSITEIFDYRNKFVHFKPRYQEYNSKLYRKMSEVTHKKVKKLYKYTIEAMKKIRDNFNIENMEWLDDKQLQEF